MAGSTRRNRWVVVLGVALVALFPVVSSAGVGTFSSTSSTPAVSASNSNGPGVRAVNGFTGESGNHNAIVGMSRAAGNSAANAAIVGTNLYTGADTGRHPGGYFTNMAPGVGTGPFDSVALFGNALSTAAGSTAAGVAGYSSGGLGTGVVGRAPADDGYGVWGLGGFAGVVGSSIGDGVFGVWSRGNLAVNEHFLDRGNVDDETPGMQGNVSGRCTIEALDASAHCFFSDSFASLNFIPIVVATPTSNPGAFWWVEAPDAPGVDESEAFKLTLASAPATDVTFNWVVVGLRDPMSISSAGDAGRRLRR